MNLVTEILIVIRGASKKSKDVVSRGPKDRKAKELATSLSTISM